MLIFGVRWPLSSVHSIGRIVNLRIDSARDTLLFARSTASCTSSRTFGFFAASASDMSVGRPLFASHVGSISGSRVTRAAMKGFWSPTTTT